MIHSLKIFLDILERKYSIMFASIWTKWDNVRNICYYGYKCFLLWSKMLKNHICGYLTSNEVLVITGKNHSVNSKLFNNIC